jgi:hypothetical protein
MTPAVQKALSILCKHRTLTPTEFARLMWPRSPSWRSSSRVGRGVALGTAIKQCGGRMLNQLCRAGFANQQQGGHYTITAQGLRALTDDLEQK